MTPNHGIPSGGERRMADTDYRTKREELVARTVKVNDGFAVYGWPEFQAFAKRLGIPIELDNKVLEIRIAVGEQPTYTMTNSGREPKPGYVDTTTQHNDAWKTGVPSSDVFVSRGDVERGIDQARDGGPWELQPIIREETMLRTFLKWKKDDKGQFVTGTFVATRGGTEYEHRVEVSRDGSSTCRVTINGKDATYNELREGDELIVDGQPAVAITATRKV